MTTDETKQLAPRAFQALAAGDFQALEGLLTPTTVLHQCGFLQPITVQALLARSYQGRLGDGSQVVDRQVQLEQLIAEGDTVALRWRTVGRYVDEDVPERNGVTVSFPSMTFLRIADGRIVEIWNMRDADTLQSSLREAAND